MKITQDSRDQAEHYRLSKPGEHGLPIYMVRCPHCATLQSKVIEVPISTFGVQGSPRVVTCDREWDASLVGDHLNRGCGRRFVVDIRVDVLATSTSIQE